MKNIFNQTELAELCGRAELVSVRPGEFLFREDDQAYALYIVKAGSLRIMSSSPRVRDHYGRRSRRRDGTDR